MVSITAAFQNPFLEGYDFPLRNMRRSQPAFRTVNNASQTSTDVWDATSYTTNHSLTITWNNGTQSWHQLGYIDLSAPEPTIKRPPVRLLLRTWLQLYRQKFTDQPEDCPRLMCADLRQKWQQSAAYQELKQDGDLWVEITEQLQSVLEAEENTVIELGWMSAAILFLEDTYPPMGCEDRASYPTILVNATQDLLIRPILFQPIHPAAPSYTLQTIALARGKQWLSEHRCILRSVLAGASMAAALDAPFCRRHWGATPVVYCDQQMAANEIQFFANPWLDLERSLS